MGTFSFDHAKTLTTGEGGMVVYKNKKTYLKGLAWHDHGHDNNPKLPRYEDTRKSSGFNFRMNELQAAVGLAQISKFDKIFETHQKNKIKILNALKKIDYLEFREMPNNSTDASESLVVIFKNAKLAKFYSKKLKLIGINTKILPEALKWHFAKYWGHMKELKHRQKLTFKKSYDILKRSISLPIMYNMEKQIPAKIYKVLSIKLK